LHTVGERSDFILYDWRLGVTLGVTFVTALINFLIAAFLGDTFDNVGVDLNLITGDALDTNLGVTLVTALINFLTAALVLGDILADVTAIFLETDLASNLTIALVLGVTFTNLADTTLTLSLALACALGVNSAKAALTLAELFLTICLIRALVLGVNLATFFGVTLATSLINFFIFSKTFTDAAFTDVDFKLFEIITLTLLGDAALTTTLDLLPCLTKTSGVLLPFNTELIGANPAGLNTGALCL
jgi:hypothetical protein